MLRRIVRPTLAVLGAAALAAATIGTAGTAGGTPSQTGSRAGPPYHFTTALIGDGNAIPLKDSGMLIRTQLGYRIWTGQQDSHLVVTLVDGGIRFADTGTKSLKKPAPACQRKKVRVGIAAVCRLPRDISVRRPLLIEVWPRLGNDHTNASTLPARFAVTVLGDKGRDVVRFGAGPDFFNGYTGGDVVRGGAGRDWIRPGVGNDRIQGGPGRDDLVALEGRDSVRGGRNNDRLWAGDGNDRVRGGAGSDLLLCGNGHDRAKVEKRDHVSPACESTDHH